MLRWTRVFSCRVRRTISPSALKYVNVQLRTMALRVKIRPTVTIVGKEKRRCSPTKPSSMLSASLAEQSHVIATGEVGSATKRPANVNNVERIRVVRNANDVPKASTENRTESGVSRVRVRKRNGISQEAALSNEIVSVASVSPGMSAIYARNAMLDTSVCRTVSMAVALNVIAIQTELCPANAITRLDNVIARKA